MKKVPGGSIKIEEIDPTKRLRSNPPFDFEVNAHQGDDPDKIEVQFKYPNFILPPDFDEAKEAIEHSMALENIAFYDKMFKRLIEYNSDGTEKEPRLDWTNRTLYNENDAVILFTAAPSFGWVSTDLMTDLIDWKDVNLWNNNEFKSNDGSQINALEQTVNGRVIVCCRMPNNDNVWYYKN